MGASGDEGEAAATEPQARIRAAAAIQAPRHRRLLQSARDGRTLSNLMMRALALYTPRGHAVLATTGRRTGQTRRNYVRAIPRGDQVYMVMLRPPALALEHPKAVTAWVHNLRSDPRVSLRLGRTVVPGRAREITDPAVLERAREAICERVHLVDYGEALLHLRGLPTRAKIVDMHRYWFDTGIPLVVDLDRSAQER